MQLSSLIASNDLFFPAADARDATITGLALDSRKVEKGDLFIAVPGTKQDGRGFIQDALTKGAAALLVTADTVLPPQPVPVIQCRDIRLATSYLAAAFYGKQPKTIAAVTGTSGKTSTAQFVREIWQQLGQASASIGTLGLVTAAGTDYGALTTPDAITLHELLHNCAQKHIDHVVLEASSHGLELHRLDHVHVQAGGFTNLSRDHLDYHQTMEAYFAAKSLLFTRIIADGGAAILNSDSNYYEPLRAHAAARKLRLISFGTKSQSDLRLIDVKPYAAGQHLLLEALGKRYDLTLPVIGSFQAWNALCALGLVLGAEPSVQTDQAIAALTKLSGVPGRLQLAGQTAKGGTVFIDYAHKPDALENVLRVLRPHLSAHPGAKLGVVFGCGGNRDQGKRPLMGGIAARLADWVIITDDNPRHENPDLIRAAILTGAHSEPEAQATITEIGDRGAAIEAGIRQCNAHDVLVIAGKGHEPGQIVGDSVLPFDDLAVARQFLSNA
ncbi:MAG: UDP-N-acetylmuramoyl-L-alanyl-D-glutamate--2,6-diaminopimelate ligase [Alphaproteobacteria bacterium]|nr:UDP-N-acetylmuramoyl-L-alanyl-D-glutamate--2,6-diaminopimelate ligase [Alphaproteobacteria bacterium]MBV8547886.1 UDP-N-acetylmuramoyl-L-alanyl-D-glutamate--2,6-diaminopimelate ligase [Alphaproteobacteria bacterium]